MIPHKTMECLLEGALVIAASGIATYAISKTLIYVLDKYPHLRENKFIKSISNAGYYLFERREDRLNGSDFAEDASSLDDEI